MSIHRLGMNFLKTTLVVSVMLAYGVSPAFAVVIEHHHPSDEEHDHSWIDWFFDRHDHHHHGSPDDPHQSDCGSHTHIVFPGSPGHVAIWAPATLPVPPGPAPMPRPDTRRVSTDAPVFGLLKPPQLS